MSNPEIPKNAPASTPRSPSDTLLKNFKVTLETRWKQFDIATMKEANSQTIGGFGAQAGRDNHPDFIKAKAAFDQARTSLNAVKDDAGLKQILNSPGNLLSAIQTLEAHFALATAPEKAKEYNHVLASTLADLTSLRSQVTETAEDKKAAEVAAVAVKAMPAVAVAAIATGGAESLLSSADAKWLMNEGSKEIKTGIKSAIAEALGFDKKTMIEDMAKRAKWETIGFMGTIRVMIFAMLSKISFLGMTDDWSPEEMSLAGLKRKVELGKTETGKEADNSAESINKIQDKNYGVATLILSEIANIKAQKWGVASIYQIPTMRTLKYSELKSAITNPAELRKKIGVGSDVTDIALLTFAKPLVDETHSLYKTVTWSYQRANTSKKIEDATLYEIIASIGPGMRTLATMKKIDITDLGGTTEELASSFIKVDDAGEVSGELVAQAEWLGLSKKILKTLFANRKQSFLKEGDLTTLLKDPNLTTEEKNKIEHIRTFGLAFQQKLLSDESLNFWNGNVVQNIVNKWGMNIGDVLKSYILTGWKTESSQMTAIEKVWAYTSFFLITGADPEWAGAITWSLINMENLAKAVKWKSIFDKVPEDVQKIMEEHFGVEAAMKKVWQLAWGAADTLGWFAKNSPGFAAILTICVLFLPVFSKRTNLVSMLTWKK